MSYDQSALAQGLLRHPLLSALCGKYEMLRDLRMRQQSEVAPREELAALAAAFPGALRELDRVPVAELARRHQVLCAVVEGSAQPERWMLLQIAYHGFMRATLRLRRVLVARDRASSQLEALPALEYEAALDEPPLERFDQDALAAIRNPPHGRLNPWVMAEVARDHGVTTLCIEDALWGAH